VMPQTNVAVGMETSTMMAAEMTTTADIQRHETLQLTEKEGEAGTAIMQAIDRALVFAAEGTPGIGTTTEAVAASEMPEDRATDLTTAAGHRLLLPLLPEHLQQQLWRQRTSGAKWSARSCAMAVPSKGLQTQLARRWPSKASMSAARP